MEEDFYSILNQEEQKFNQILQEFNLISSFSIDDNTEIKNIIEQMSNNNILNLFKKLTKLMLNKKLDKIFDYRNETLRFMSNKLDLLEETLNGDYYGDIIEPIRVAFRRAEFGNEITYFQGHLPPYTYDVNFGDDNIRDLVLNLVNSNSNIFQNTKNLIMDALINSKIVNYNIIRQTKKDDIANFVNNNGPNSIYYKYILNRNKYILNDNILFTNDINSYFTNERNYLENVDKYPVIFYNQNKFNQFINQLELKRPEILELNRKYNFLMDFHTPIRRIIRIIKEIYKEREISSTVLWNARSDIYREIREQERLIRQEERMASRNIPGFEIVTDDDDYYQGFNYQEEDDILDADDTFQQGLLNYNPSEYYLDLLEQKSLEHEINQMIKDNVDKKYISLKVMELNAVKDKIERESNEYINYYNTMVNEIGLESTELLYSNIKELLKDNRIKIEDVKEIFKDLGIIPVNKLNKLFENLSIELFSELQNIKNDNLRKNIIRNAMEAGKKKLKSLKKKMLKKKSKKLKKKKSKN